MFNHHRQMVESGELQSQRSKLYFFLLSITDRAEKINKYMNNISLSLIVITPQGFNQWLPDQNFEPHYLGLYGEMKSIMSECVVKTTKHIAQVSNVNIVIVGNADSLLSQHEKETPVDWNYKSKICVPSEKYTSY